MKKFKRSVLVTLVRIFRETRFREVESYYFQQRLSIDNKGKVEKLDINSTVASMRP